MSDILKNKDIVIQNIRDLKLGGATMTEKMRNLIKMSLLLREYLRNSGKNGHQMEKQLKLKVFGNIRVLDIRHAQTFKKLTYIPLIRPQITTLLDQFQM